MCIHCFACCPPLIAFCLIYISNDVNHKGMDRAAKAPPLVFATAMGGAPSTFRERRPSNEGIQSTRSINERKASFRKSITVHTPAIKVMQVKPTEQPTTMIVRRPARRVSLPPCLHVNNAGGTGGSGS